MTNPHTVSLFIRAVLAARIMKVDEHPQTRRFIPRARDRLLIKKSQSFTPPSSTGREADVVYLCVKKLQTMNTAGCLCGVKSDESTKHVLEYVSSTDSPTSSENTTASTKMKSIHHNVV